MFLEFYFREGTKNKKYPNFDFWFFNLRENFSKCQRKKWVNFDVVIAPPPCLELKRCIIPRVQNIFFYSCTLVYNIENYMLQLFVCTMFLFLMHGYGISKKVNSDVLASVNARLILTCRISPWTSWMSGSLDGAQLLL